jgi:hypothetical protein
LKADLGDKNGEQVNLIAAGESLLNFIQPINGKI